MAKVKQEVIQINELNIANYRTELTLLETLKNLKTKKEEIVLDEQDTLILLAKFDGKTEYEYEGIKWSLKFSEVVKKIDYPVTAKTMGCDIDDFKIPKTLQYFDEAKLKEFVPDSGIIWKYETKLSSYKIKELK